VLRCASPLRVTAIARRGYWRPRRFADRNRPYGRFGQQNVLVAKGRRGGRESRLAKRSGATCEAGLALRRARLDGGAVFGICALVSESRQSEAGEELSISRCFFEGCAPGGSTHPQFPRTALRASGNPGEPSRLPDRPCWIPAYAGMTTRRQYDPPCHSRESGKPGSLRACRIGRAGFPLARE